MDMTSKIGDFNNDTDLVDEYGDYMELIQNELSYGKYDSTYRMIIADLQHCQMTEADKYRLIYRLLLPLLKKAKSITVTGDDFQILLTISAPRKQVFQLIQDIWEFTNRTWTCKKEVFAYYGKQEVRLEDYDFVGFCYRETIWLPGNLSVFQEKAISNIKTTGGALFDWHILDRLTLDNDVICNLLCAAADIHYRTVISNLESIMKLRLWRNNCLGDISVIRTILDVLDMYILENNQTYSLDKFRDPINKLFHAILQHGQDLSNRTPLMHTILVSQCKELFDNTLEIDTNTLHFHNLDFTCIRKSLCTDCTIVLVDGSTHREVYKAHMAVVCTLSKMLNACLLGNFKESKDKTVTLVDSNPTLVKTILDSAYSAELHLKGLTSLEIREALRILDKLDIDFKVNWKIVID